MSSATEQHPDLGRLIDLVAGGGVLVMSGAGISTASGIPDYRDSSGRLRNALPMTYQRFVSSEHERRRYWARSFVGWPRMAEARPNPAHDAVVRLERSGLLTGVVTQNVDGLHTKAGTRTVVDLHGRLDRVVCLGCGRRRPRLELQLRLAVLNPGPARMATRRRASDRPDGDVELDEQHSAGFRVPSCRACGGVLKPDVVFFGELIPPARLERGTALLERSRTLLVLGSSLAVGSGYRFVTRAKRRGLAVAVVNRGVTRGDRHADIKIDADLDGVLRGVAAACGRPIAA